MNIPQMQGRLKRKLGRIDDYMGTKHQPGLLDLLPELCYTISKRSKGERRISALDALSKIVNAQIKVVIGGFE